MRRAHALLMDWPSHPPPPPMCQFCDRRSAVFLVNERDDRGTRDVLLCTECLGHRAFVWERFTIPVLVDYLDRRGT